VIQLVDDQLLGAILRNEPPPLADAAVYTTGYWYVRLCQVVLRADARSGSLSSPLSALPVASRERALAALLELPDTIGLLSLRVLAPEIGRLRRTYQLNILGLEVLAAAVHLGATVVLSVESPRLEAALRDEHCDVIVGGTSDG
jgi:hypothetical protein